MLARYVLRLRRESKAVRQRHVLFWSVAITAVVALIWGVSLPHLMKPLPSGDTLAEAKEQTRPLGSLWSQAREQMANLMSSITASSTEATDTSWIASSTDTSVVSQGMAATATAIVLSPEDIQKAQARANIMYRPATTTVAATATTTPAPQVVLIATTTRGTPSLGR